MQDWHPPDLTASLNLRKDHPDIKTAPGPWYIIALLGKEAPFQRQLAIEYLKLPVADQLACASLSGLSTKRSPLDARIIKAGMIVTRVIRQPVGWLTTQRSTSLDIWFALLSKSKITGTLLAK